MKVGLVLDDSLDPPDGVQQYVLTVGAWLTKNGHTVHYLVGETKRTDIPHVKSLSRNIKVSFNQNVMRIPLPTSRASLKSLLAREQYDVLHVQTPYSPWLAARLITAAPDNCAIIGTFHIVPHGAFVSLMNYLLALYVRRSLQRFDTMIAVSVAAADFTKRAYKLDTKIIPNAVGLQRFKTNVGPRGVLKIVYLGRLVPRKGCLTLLKALELLNHNEVPNFTVEIAGKGPLRTKLEEFAKVKKLKNVSFTGYVDEADKPGLLASADICVFPSTGGESFGISLVEAMANGHSLVLAGDNSGYRSVLSDFPDLLFEPNNEGELANKLTYYLNNVNEARTVAGQLAKHAEQYDTSVVSPQIVTIYQDALRNHRN